MNKTVLRGIIHRLTIAHRGGGVFIRGKTGYLVPGGKISNKDMVRERDRKRIFGSGKLIANSTQDRFGFQLREVRCPEDEMRFCALVVHAAYCSGHSS
jgi:hypothetical protein